MGDDDDRRRTEISLEEARTSKNEAIEKKCKEEKQIEKEKDIRQQRLHNDDDRGEMEAYLVEARRLKQDPLDKIGTENRKDEKPNAYTPATKIPPNNSSCQQKIDFIGGRSKDKELSIEEEQKRKRMEEKMEVVRRLNEEKRERLKKKQRDVKLTEERRHQELTIRPDETVKEKTFKKESKTEATQTGSIYHSDDKV